MASGGAAVLRLTAYAVAAGVSAALALLVVLCGLPRLLHQAAQDLRHEQTLRPS